MAYKSYMCCKSADKQLLVVSHQSSVASFEISLYPALLLLHGNNLDEALYLGLAGLLYIVVMASYSHWKTARLKREKARRKAERAAERARRQTAAELLPPTPASNSTTEPVNSNNELT